MTWRVVEWGGGWGRDSWIQGPPAAPLPGCVRMLCSPPAPVPFSVVLCQPGFPSLLEVVSLKEKCRYCQCPCCPRDEEIRDGEIEMHWLAESWQQSCRRRGEF